MKLFSASKQSCFCGLSRQLAMTRANSHTPVEEIPRIGTDVPILYQYFTILECTISPSLVLPMLISSTCNAHLKVHEASLESAG